MRGSIVYIMTLASVRYTENAMSPSVMDIPSMCMKVSDIEKARGGFVCPLCVTGAGNSLQSGTFGIPSSKSVSTGSSRPIDLIFSIAEHSARIAKLTQRPWRIGIPSIFTSLICINLELVWIRGDV